MLKYDDETMEQAEARHAEIQKIRDRVNAQYLAQYPQSFLGIWRGADVIVSGQLQIDLLYGKSTKENVVAALVKLMQDTADWHRIENSFVILERTSELSTDHLPDGSRVVMSDRVIESIYTFRDGVWRHVGGLDLGFFEQLVVEVAECQRCGTKEKLHFAPDPYQADVNGDFTDVWLCEECAYEQAQEV